MLERDGSGAGEGPGEIFMSIEETNKLRISLGLKPLEMDGNKAEKERKAASDRRKAQEETAASQTLAERIAQSKERRRQQAALDSTQKLSAPDGEVDDAMAWIERSRRLAAEKKPGITGNSKKQPTAHTGADLTGVKIKHDFDELEAGESVVLTLEDRAILDEKGNLAESEEDDVALENILMRETRGRERAYRAAGKTAKPLWEEDGKQRTLLDKYDEEEQEVLVIGERGRLDVGPSSRRQEADVRAALKAGLEALEASKNASNASSDFFTPEEMEQFAKKKKSTTKKVRKLKKKALTAEELETLAAETAVTAGKDADLASRASREVRAAAGDRAAAAQADERRARFDSAIQKANYASLGLKNEDAQLGPDEEDDPELAASLARARALALKRGSNDSTTLAEQMRKRREEQERADASVAKTDGLVFSDVGEITRTIQVGAAQSDEKKEEENGNANVSPMDTREEGAPAEQFEDEDDQEEDQDKGAQDMDGGGSWGMWAPAGEESALDSKPKAKSRPNMRKKKQEEEGTVPNNEPSLAAEGVIGDRVIGSGMAGALAFLQSRGDLEKPVEWSGRTNDVKKAQGDQLGEVYTGGKSSDRIALDVEVALTRKDEYGRLLTPKEAFRQQCHSFHGIFPSKNSIAKRQRQAEEEMKSKRAATGALESGALEQMKRVQKKQATPYVVLSGTVKPGQSREAMAGLFGPSELDEGDVVF